MSDTEFDVLSYLCPPIAALAIIDHVLAAGDPVRLVRWLKATVKQKQTKGEVIPDEIMGWVEALDSISYHMASEHSKALIEMWRDRMAKVNRGSSYALAELGAQDWAATGGWLDELPELSPDEDSEQGVLIDIPPVKVYV